LNPSLDPADTAAARAAMAQGQADAAHRQDYYGAQTAGGGLGVPAGSMGEHENTPLPLPDDPAVTGVGGA
jgi:hypothetical protein